MADQELSIEELYQSYDPPKGSGNFFGLEDGKTARVRFMSEPYVYQDAFKQPDGQTKLSTRYIWVIWNHDEKKAQILKQSGTFYTSLAALVKNPDFGDPKEYDIHIGREGTGTDTKYTVNGARKNIELDEKALEAVAALDITKDAKEPIMMSLRDFIKAGKQFLDKDGMPMIRDLDAEKAPVKDI
jgi:hypothetical protein